MWWMKLNILPEMLEWTGVLSKIKYSKLLFSGFIQKNGNIYPFHLNCKLTWNKQEEEEEDRQNWENKELSKVEMMFEMNNIQGVHIFSILILIYRHGHFLPVQFLCILQHLNYLDPKKIYRVTQKKRGTSVQGSFWGFKWYQIKNRK